jgi:hypothetical protein
MRRRERERRNSILGLRIMPKMIPPLRLMPAALEAVDAGGTRGSRRTFGYKGITSTSTSSRGRPDDKTMLSIGETSE